MCNLQNSNSCVCFFTASIFQLVAYPQVLYKLDITNSNACNGQEDVTGRIGQ